MSDLDALVRAVAGGAAYQLLQDRAGREVVRVRHGAGHHTIVKFDRNAARSERERGVLEHVARSPAAGLAPAVLGHGRCPDGSSYLCLEDVAGGRPGVTGSLGEWVRIGAALRRLHTGLAGWVPTDSAGPGQIREFAVGHLRTLVARGELDRRCADAILAVVPASAGRRSTTVHGDLKREHVFDRVPVVRFIDYADVRLGDPLWDVAVLSLDHPDRTDQLLAGYGRDDPSDRRDVRAYRLVRAAGDVNFARRAERPTAGPLRRLHLLIARIDRRHP